MDWVITQGGAHFERFANLIDSQCPSGEISGLEVQVDLIYDRKSIRLTGFDTL
jgi:hypothetical protein